MQNRYANLKQRRSKQHLHCDELYLQRALLIQALTSSIVVGLNSVYVAEFTLNRGEMKNGVSLILI